MELQFCFGRFAVREERLASEGRLKYRGTACIRLEFLHFPWNEPREPNQKNLKKCCEKGQCDRLMQNHIPAVIDVLQASKVEAERLLTNTKNPHPELRFPAGDTDFWQRERSYHRRKDGGR